MVLREGWITCNTDGASKGNPGQSAFEAQNIKEVTNMEAELETDSLVLKHMITKNWRIPWELVEKMEDILHMVTQINVHVHYIFKEANPLADYVANSAISKEEKQLPSMGRKILNIDKHQIPSVRIKTRRIIIDNNGQHA
ncbi:hypothetical protein KY290_006335 [Solanum tuberosum]|uniref:RNase H family protein n=1 Tax=Solanum tuberosum TaxID=4113 RepID=A0ABQ7WIK2_SOLTU|nr:hypothetical protein KY289_006708 [Solanum tuberosum]KAH0751301.1 hypothetical protein KY285_004449 [Solanum tuberosum]KAH0779908.1 hypothetical protein KY290_006335 [Solanum tuberosum]